MAATKNDHGNVAATERFKRLGDRGITKAKKAPFSWGLFASCAGRFDRCTTRFLGLSAFGLQPERPSVVWYDALVPNEAEAQNAERKLRAAARAGRMTVEVVALGDFKPSPYASSTPEERLAAAVRLIEHHQALRGGFSKLPRSAWPGEVVLAGEGLG